MSLALCAAAAMNFAPSLLIALVSLATGKEAVPPAGKPTAGLNQVYRYVDRSGSQSRVERTVGRDGADTLHGVSDLVPAHGPSTRIEEWVRLDRNGRLARAEISRVGLQGGWDRLVMDVAAGTVVVSQRGQTSRWTVPAGNALLYAGVVDGRGQTVSTPIAAWVAFRAAQVSADVRVVYLDSRSSYLAPRDQIAVATEVGTTVVLANDGADVDDSGFVARVRLAALGTTLGRVTESAKLRAPKKDAVL